MIRLAAVNAAVRIVGIQGGENVITRVADVITEEIQTALEQLPGPEYDEMYADA